jgi:glycosyltransferase involved in cell wall biosynthesis
MKPLVAIVVPCFNEEKRLPIDSFKSFSSNYPHITFCFVNDGSRDNTSKILKDSGLRVMDLKQNVGKAEAVRTGVISMANEGFQWIGFWDADLATPLEEIPHFLEKAQNSKFKLITGARILRMGTLIQRKAHRHYLGRIFATLVSLSLKLPVYDTQCGAKLFSNKLAGELFSLPFRSKWFFDVELLFRLKDKTLVYEYPLHQWVDISGSKLKLWDFIKVPYELYKINRFYKGKSP